MRAPRSGFSVLELLISLALTLVVMAVVFELTRRMEAIYRAESAAIERTAGAIRALDEITAEIARSGHGLGLPAHSVAPCGSDSLTLRSNPEGIAAPADYDPERGLVLPAGFSAGERVLLVDRLGRSERALVTGGEAGPLALRSLDSADGSLERLLPGAEPFRLLKLREVRFHLESGLLLKSEADLEWPIAGRVSALGFECLDEHGAALVGPAAAARAPAAIRVRLALDPPGPNPSGRPAAPPALATAAALERNSAIVDFEFPGPVLRLVELLHPLAWPAAVASRRGASWGILLGGKNAYQDRAYILSFPLEKRFLSAMVENAFFLEDVRGPVAMCFGPEEVPAAGSLFLAAWGLRRGHVARVFPDSRGVISHLSRVVAFDGTEALAMAGGIGFGPDGALYLTSQENGGIYRYRFDMGGNPIPPPDRVARVEGSPGAVAPGPDGSLYFGVELDRESTLWKLPFNETLSGEPAHPVAALSGRVVGLVLDPLGSSLFALLRERRDVVLVELSPSWLLDPLENPPEILRWSTFRRDMEERRLPPGSIHAARNLVPETLDLLGLDQAGSLYLGSSEGGVVLKFDMKRQGPGRRHAVGIAAVVDDSSPTPRVRLHAWKEHLF